MFAFWCMSVAYFMLNISCSAFWLCLQAQTKMLFFPHEALNNLEAESLKDHLIYAFDLDFIMLTEGSLKQMRITL